MLVNHNFYIKSLILLLITQSSNYIHLKFAECLFSHRFLINLFTDTQGLNNNLLGGPSNTQGNNYLAEVAFFCVYIISVYSL